MADDTQLTIALERSAEAADLDFKSTFDANQAGDWLEIIKDIAALANSGGGTILVGLNDDGSPSGTDVSGALSIDPADLTNKVHKYTGIQFDGFEVAECHKREHLICAISVCGWRIPIVFTRVGTYEAAPGK